MYALIPESEICRVKPVKILNLSLNRDKFVLSEGI